MQPGKADVSGRQRVARPGALEHGARSLVLASGHVRSGSFPVAASEVDPVLSCVDLFACRLEERNALLKELLGAARIIRPVVGPPGLAEEARPGEVVADVPQEPFIKGGRLGKRLVVFSLFGGPDPDGNGILPPVRREQMECEVDRRNAFLLGQNIGGEPVELLSMRRDHVLVDRLARQRVAKSVPAVVMRFLFEKLLLHARVKSGLYASIVLRRNREEQRIAERPAEHRRRLQDVGLLRRQLLDAQEDRVADGLGEAQVVEILPLPPRLGAVDVAPVDRVLEQLFEDEWIAL